MRKIVIFFIILINLFYFVIGGEAHSLQIGDKIKAKVIRVYDGDTLTILHNGEKVKIRLYAIDAPELKQEYGSYAKETLQLWTEEKEVLVIVRGFDRYARVVATVIGEGIFSGSVDVAYRLLEKGEAWYEAKYCNELLHASLCADYEYIFEKSKKNKEGLFGRKNPVKPSDFRKVAKK